MVDTRLLRREEMVANGLYDLTPGPLLLFERQSWFTRLPRKLSMVTNISRVFDQLSWIMISLMTFFGFCFLLVVVPISNAYGAKVSPWQVDYATPASVNQKVVSIQTRENVLFISIFFYKVLGSICCAQFYCTMY